MEFSRQEYWSGLPFPSPGDLPNPGIKLRSPALQADALTSEPPGEPFTLNLPKLLSLHITTIPINSYSALITDHDTWNFIPEIPKSVFSLLSVNLSKINQNLFFFSCKSLFSKFAHLSSFLAKTWYINCWSTHYSTDFYLPYVLQLIILSCFDTRCRLRNTLYLLYVFLQAIAWGF